MLCALSDGGRGESCATFKSALTDIPHSFGDKDGGKSCAALESIVTDVGELDGEVDGLQSDAAFKSSFVNDAQGGGELYINEGRTLGEGFVTHFAYTVPDALVTDEIGDSYSLCILAASHADDLYGSVCTVNDVVGDTLIVEVLGFCLNTAAQNC